MGLRTCLFTNFQKNVDVPSRDQTLRTVLLTVKENSNYAKHVSFLFSNGNSKEKWERTLEVCFEKMRGRFLRKVHSYVKVQVKERSSFQRQILYHFKVSLSAF